MLFRSQSDILKGSGHTVLIDLNVASSCDIFPVQDNAPGIRDWSISADYIWLNYSGANRLQRVSNVSGLFLSFHA